MWQLWLENGYRLVLTGGAETGKCHSLVRRVHVGPLGGMEGVHWVVIGCAQPNRCKISSTNPNGCQFTRWRWLLLESGCLPTLRSL